MKKLMKILVILIVVYFIISFIISYFSIGHNIAYTIIQKKSQIEVKEVYKKSSNKNLESYKVDIYIHKELFEIQLINKYNKEKQILTNIEYIADKKYKCILPIFKGDEILTDILCKDKNGVYHNYLNIADKSDVLKKFADNQIKNGYNKIKYYDNKNKGSKYGLMTLYKNNTTSNLAFGITNYRGLHILIDNKIENIKLFDNDVYSREISAFVDNYYFVANYNQKYDFNSFFLIDLKSGKQNEIKTKNPIAHDSYIAGIVNGNIYIVDKSNKKQYVISVFTKNIKEVGNEQKNMVFYDNNEFSTVPYTRMTLKNTYFKNYKIDAVGKYNMFLKTIGINNGYSYYYEKVGNEYSIYRSITGTAAKKYLFKINSVKDIKAIGNYIFYQDKNEIKYYSDETGFRTLLLDSELEFNNNIIYGIYEK